MKVRMSDIIEEFIKEMMKDEDDFIEIQRNELAEHFNCVPSQINYVIATRFRPQQGYYVESRRGGGGHIRIKKVSNDKEDFFMHIISNIGDQTTSNEVDILISNLLSYKMIDETIAKLLKVATSDNVLTVPQDTKDKLRANILKNMLLNIN
ncbi:MAG: CtsR family transcriptional regulator [Clostridia bacterium]|nr:CtsR family transcriptional regulator [Clostridia bacterium]